MNSNLLFGKSYCSNIADEEPDKGLCWSLFLGFGSVFVEIQSRVGVALSDHDLTKIFLIF
jgi:hypothetical protein